VAKSTKHKSTAVAVPVPQSLAEARVAITRLGQLDRQKRKIELRLSEGVAKLKADAETAAGPIGTEMEQVTEGLKIWAEANRVTLTEGGRTKTVDLGTGEISWRIRPPKVSVRGGDEAAIAALKAAGLDRFVRISEEVDRAAIQREPEAVATINSIRVGSEGEDFIVKPAEEALSDAPGAAG
jgi:phage host-nuclease inhibitor protein Gam